MDGFQALYIHYGAKRVVPSGRRIACGDFAEEDL
jgi:hypothetical protein